MRVALGPAQAEGAARDINQAEGAARDINQAAGTAHLSYCTNIHPGESLREVRQALATHVTRVKAALSPDAPFGVGLRLANAASSELCRQPDALHELRSWLEDAGLYVFTLNGFPYGAFHATRVKEAVYQPDWRSPERLHYTTQLGQVLSALLPDGVDGSISTVPGAFAAALSTDAEHVRIADNLLQAAAAFARLHQQTGKTLALALEPEPSCMLETIEQSVAFFERRLFCAAGAERFAQLTGLGHAAAQDALRRHLGLCLDSCHAAVEYEDAPQLLAQLSAAGIDVKKLQLSSGLRVPKLDESARAALRAFHDDVYLHQTVARAHGQLTRYVDLPQALSACSDADAAELRVHFHVPVFAERYGVLESTQSFLRELLARQRQAPISAHLEVETYTWDVLPAHARGADVTQDIARELRFVLAELSGTIGGA